jgi:hypothetical protein
LKGPELTNLRGLGLGTEDEISGEEIPRIGPSYGIDMEREREREFLEALRSPEIEPTGTRANSGGWGLGAGNVENIKPGEEEEEEDEPLDWDQAQAVVERMVGMNNHQDLRRRVT